MPPRHTRTLAALARDPPIRVHLRSGRSAPRISILYPRYFPRSRIRGSLPEVIRSCSWCAHHHHHHKVFAGRYSFIIPRTQTGRVNHPNLPGRAQPVGNAQRARRHLAGLARGTGRGGLSVHSFIIPRSQTVRVNHPNLRGGTRRAYCVGAPRYFGPQGS